MIPKHIRRVHKDRQAVAPYNFIELPDKIVKAQPLPSGDRYYPDKNSQLPRQTGRIECTLTTSSPLYTRCGLTLAQFSFYQKQLREGKEVPDYPDFFYIDLQTKHPAISGSSLRGMMRTLVEIISFSKIDRVSEHQKFFFRAVAADDEDPLKYEYRKYFGKNGQNVKAGYLQQKDDEWSICPAMPIDNAPFVWVEEETVKFSKIPGLILMEQLSDYRPQYFEEISFGDIDTRNNRKFAKKVSNNCSAYKYKGVLVTSGNMLEGATSVSEQKRKNHCLIRERDPNATPIPIDKDAVQDYRNALTAFQKQNPPFNPDSGVLEDGRPVFYCQPKGGEPVRLFGQSPNFRIPYIPKSKTRAASAVDFIPENLRDMTIIDLADTIFGWIRCEDADKKLPKGIDKQRAGRVFVSDAKYKTDINGIWYTGNQESTVIPQILASPKPTTFQHYLVQPEETKADKKNLKHYASKPVEETVIRGHKLYWHKGSNIDFKHPNPKDASDTQLTEIKPINKDVTFEFTIQFENLSHIELGALMWVLDIAQNDNYRLKLGMGKPLGMGAVKIESELYLSDRHKRYTKLFNGKSWETGETLENKPDYHRLFENYMLEQLQQTGGFKEIPRIRMLLEILKWEENLSKKYLEQRRYMEIERQQPPRIGDDENEYKQRPVLPNPLDVMGIKSPPSPPKPKKDNGTIVVTTH